MPKKITSEDIARVWHTYESFQGVPTPTKEEIERGAKKLLRMAGITSDLYVIKFTSGRNYTRWIDTATLNINPEVSNNVWRDVVRACSWRAKRTYWPSLEYRMARRVCESDWLVGILKPVVKPVVKPTKQQARAAKIARLEARREVWEKRWTRAHNAIKKIDRSLTAYRRHDEDR